MYFLDLGALLSNFFINESDIDFADDFNNGFANDAMGHIIGNISRRSKNPLNCTILDSWVFENLILLDETFTKALRMLKYFVLVKIIYVENYVSSLESPITFDERFKVTWVSFFVPDFNLLRCNLNNSQ